MPTKLMGILNVTPDSFFDGGTYTTVEKACGQADKLVRDGADLLDIGGEATRPPNVYGSDAQISPQEELDRVLPVLDALKGRYSIPLSIDTRRPLVARAAVERGATLINDVYGFRDPELIEVAAEASTYVCIGHMQGEPATMQLSPHYPDGVMNTLLAFFEERVDTLVKQGVKENRIYLDPGIGFGKTVADNLTIIQNVALLKRLGFPLLLGVSRKIFLAKIVEKPAKELLAATLAVNAKLMLEGVEMLRVHDVAEHNDMRKVLFPH